MSFVTISIAFYTCISRKQLCLKDGAGMSFVGGIVCPQASQTCYNISPFLEVTLPSLNSSSSFEAVMGWMDWAADKFVWVHLPNERFRPGKRSCVPVLAHPPNRRYYHPFWYAGFLNLQLYSRSWVGLKWAMVPMAPMAGGYNSCNAESDFVGLPQSLLIC